MIWDVEWENRELTWQSQGDQQWVPEAEPELQNSSCLVQLGRLGAPLRVRLRPRVLVAPMNALMGIHFLLLGALGN